jgi:putative lipoic acid-binding regulatory protein
VLFGIDIITKNQKNKIINMKIKDKLIKIIKVWGLENSSLVDDVLDLIQKEKEKSIKEFIKYYNGQHGVYTSSLNKYMEEFINKPKSKPKNVYDIINNMIEGVH